MEVLPASQSKDKEECKNWTQFFMMLVPVPAKDNELEVLISDL